MFIFCFLSFDTEIFSVLVILALGFRLITIFGEKQI